ncbi:MAG: hypothetical protein EOP62_12775 [Sphingomonadales bacterium]|nr:MAG: hypothetical protein EOP62_12775 [Sphingomonadales bacterium]
MDLPYQTLTQFAGLGLTLLAGWFLGLATAPGGGKWRDRFHDVEVEHARYRDEAEADIRAKTKRIRELESLARAPAVAAAAAEPGTGWRGWFGWGRDNLVRIRGIDEPREKRLNELGIKTYREIEKMTAEDESALEQRLGLATGTIGNEGWREQAALLGAGNEDEHSKRFS